MLIIPEIQTVFLMVPRTASSTIKKQVLHHYPKSFMLYRHMEADGIPHGYNRWRKMGVVRHPLERLFSLWKDLKSYQGVHPEYVERMRRSVDMPFYEWLTTNREVFTDPYDTSDGMG